MYKIFLALNLEFMISKYDMFSKRDSRTVKPYQTLNKNFHQMENTLEVYLVEGPRIRWECAWSV